MGKHERQLIEDAEKIIVKILNSESLNASDRDNHWFKHVEAIAAKIIRDFKNIRSARHLGNRYDSVGDISITTGGREILIETKMSDTLSGIGTEANLGQDTLTELPLFSGKVESWSRSREKKGHDRWVTQYLDRFTRYPSEILKIDNSTKRREEKARFLRELKKSGVVSARKVLDSIHERDRAEKLEYLAYLSGKKQNPEMVRRFLILITSGVHTQKPLGDLITKSRLSREVQNLYVYYANPSHGGISVRREDAGNKAKELLKKYDRFEVTFPKGVTHCKIIGFREGKAVPLLQVVLHWKNIAQGIKTPCLNIFHLT